VQRSTLNSVAQVKISGDKRVLNTAAEHLLHKTDAAINEIAMKTLEGHVRGVCATLTIEEINSDRDTISARIQNMAGNDLMNMGIAIRSFVIRDLEDNYGYLDALGIKKTEEVKRDARVGKAIANREATIQEAKAAQEGEQANAEAEAQVAVYHRDREPKARSRRSARTGKFPSPFRTPAGSRSLLSRKGLSTFATRKRALKLSGKRSCARSKNRKPFSMFRQRPRPMPSWQKPRENGRGCSL
jgi:hypothetical protein